jgi:YHS domain-containing protein
MPMMWNMLPGSQSRLFALIVACALLLATAAAHAQGTVRLVLKGYDPVAYFKLGAPRQGDPAFSLDWDGGRYQFISAEHRDLFAADPERYAPNFGGFCTGFMARGVRSEGDPHGWVIQEGRLYVFGQAKFRDVALADPNFIASRLAAARSNWQKLKSGP